MVYFYSVFRTELSLFVPRHLSRHWSWWFHHPEYALHQFGNFSTIQRDLPPITGVSILLQGHETALSLWSPSSAKRTRALPLRDNDPPHCSPVMSPHDRHASQLPSLFFPHPFALLPNIQWLSWSKAAVLTPVISPGMYDYMLPHFAILYLVAI